MRGLGDTYADDDYDGDEDHDKDDVAAADNSDDSVDDND
jgi:hypothetical protein